MSLGNLLLWECLEHYRVPSGILGLHPLVANSILTSVTIRMPADLLLLLLGQLSLVKES